MSRNSDADVGRVTLVLLSVLAMYSLSVLALDAQPRMDPRGQIHALLQSRFNAAVRAAVPGARLETIPLPDGRDYEYLRWRVGEDQRDVTIYVMPTPKEAQQGLSTMRSGIAVERHVLRGVGDEAVLITPNAKGYQRVLFRRGRIVLLVGTPVAHGVIGFAKIFDTQVARAIRAQEISEP
jgi:hypothetical protein